MMADLPDPCAKVKTGIGAGWGCRTHGRPWPCRVGEQLGEQLALLGGRTSEATGVLAEVAAERLYVLDLHPPAADDTRDALDWIERLGEYVERLAVEVSRLEQAVMMGDDASVSFTRYRHRLIQTAGIAVAAAESIDRLKKGEADASG
jgi:hypothetical protein